MPSRETSGQLTVRQRELSAIDDFLTSRRSGLLITGEPGVGKSRLLRTALSRSPVDALLIRSGRGDQTPYSSLTGRELYGRGARLVRLDRLLIQLVATSGDRRQRVLEELVAMGHDTATLAEPLVIAVDDLDALDPATRELVLTGLHGPGWRQVIARDGSAADALDAFELLVLKGLDQAAAGDLLAHLHGQVSSLVVERLVRQSRGNPKVLLDLADQLPAPALAGVVPLPCPLRVGTATAQLLGGELADLDQDQLIPLGLFAFHDQIAAPVIEAVTGAEPVEQLRHRGLLVLELDHYRVAKPATALLAWSRLPDVTKGEAHRRAADAFRPTDVINSGYHRCLARPGTAAAAELAEIDPRGRPDRAVDCYRLLGVAYPFGSEPDPAVELRRSRLELSLGYFELALESVRRALRQDPEPELALRLQLVGLVAAQFGSAECSDLVLDPDVVARVPGPVRTRIAPLIAHHLLRVGMTDEAADLIDALDEFADQDPARSRAVVAALRSDLGLETDGADPARARGAIRQLATTIDPGCDVGPLAMLPELMAIGDLKECRRLIGLARRAVAGPADEDRLLLNLLSARIELAEGRFTRAHQQLQAIRRSRPTWAGLLVQGALIRCEAALGTLAEDPMELLPRADIGSSRIRAGYEADIGHALLLAGRHAEAAYCLSTALERSRLLEQGGTATLADLVEAHLLAGRPDQAARAARTQRDRLLDADTEPAAAVLARIDALLDTGPDAEQAYERALAVRTGRVRDHDRGRTLICYGRWLLGQGRKEDAAGRFGEATYVMRSLGLEGWVDHIQRLSRAGGAGSRRQQARMEDRRTRLQQIQDSDRELVEHLLSGHTYDQIAARMYLSRRTVASRLKAVYHRLGVANRAELVSFVADNRPEWLRTA